MFSAFNPSKCTHTWSSGQPTLRRPGSSWGFGALPKGLTLVVDTSSQRFGIRTHILGLLRVPIRPNPLGHDCPQNDTVAEKCKTNHDSENKIKNDKHKYKSKKNYNNNDKSENKTTSQKTQRQIGKGEAAPLLWNR